MPDCHPVVNCEAKKVEKLQQQKMFLLIVSPGDKEQPAFLLPAHLPESSLQQVASLPAVNQLPSVHSSSLEFSTKVHDHSLCAF